jgi:hypothetical protein
MRKKLVVLCLIAVMLTLSAGLLAGCGGLDKNFSDFDKLKTYVQKNAEVNFLFPDMNLVRQISNDFAGESKNKFHGGIRFGLFEDAEKLKFYSAGYSPVWDRRKEKYGPVTVCGTAKNVYHPEFIDEDLESYLKSEHNEHLIKNVMVITFVTFSSNLIDHTSQERVIYLLEICAAFELDDVFYTVVICDRSGRLYEENSLTQNKFLIDKYTADLLGIVDSMLN